MQRVTVGILLLVQEDVQQRCHPAVWQVLQLWQRAAYLTNHTIYTTLCYITLYNKRANTVDMSMQG